MREWIEQKIAEHRNRIAAGRQLLAQLAEQQEVITRELLQREGAVTALLEVAEQLPAPEPEAA